MFNIKLGKSYIPKNVKITNRYAIRGVILDGNKILMIKTNKGDYKFPGGGTEGDEKAFDTLKREILEESGFGIKDTIEELGEITESNEDIYEENAYFVMKSKYYKCEINDTKVSQSLDDYEVELGFEEVFIPIEKALNTNKELLAKGTDINPWVNRETIALQEVFNKYFNISNA